MAKEQFMETDNVSYHNGLSALLEEDLTSWEFFNSLSDKQRRMIEKQDISSFSDLQEYVETLRMQGIE